MNEAKLAAIEKRDRECVPLDGSPLEQDEKDRRDLLEHVADIQARLTAAKKDAEILDWMEKHNWSTEGALDCLHSGSIRKWVSDRTKI